MALQRINQELEDKLYRMVRASPRGHPAPPALGPQLWNAERGVPAWLASCCPRGTEPQALFPRSHHPPHQGLGRSHHFHPQGCSQDQEGVGSEPHPVRMQAPAWRQVSGAPRERTRSGAVTRPSSQPWEARGQSSGPG